MTCSNIIYDPSPEFPPAVLKEQHIEEEFIDRFDERVLPKCALGHTISRYMVLVARCSHEH